MNETPFSCGSMMGQGPSNAVLCRPLEQLKQEHIPLREKMERFYLLAKQVGTEPGGDVKTQLAELLDHITIFKKELDSHSIREEEGLFPLMATYIGRDAGPIAVMEYEHDRAKEHLRKFVAEMEQTGGDTQPEEAKSIAGNAMQAYLTLADHFTKEETILFPMAERLLSAAEKEQLDQMFQGK